MLRMICALFVLTPLSSAADSDDEVRKEFLALKGNWETVALEVDGKQLPKDKTPPFTFTFGTDGKSTGKTPEGEFNCTITINPKASPKTIDNKHESGEYQGKKQYGVYKLEGDKLTVCMTPPGKVEADRPKDFNTKGSSNVVFIFERIGDNKKEMALLDGEWSMVSGQANGFSMPKETVNTGKRVAKNGETTITIGGQVYFKAKFTIDASKMPKTIDYMMTEGPTKGKTHLGIYELDGDSVKFCFAVPGKDRPTEFSSKEGSQWTISVWKRVKK